MTRRTRRAWGLFRQPRIEEEVDSELAFHVEMTIQMLVSEGMSQEAARAEAVRRFGDMAVVSAECQRFGRQRDRSRSRAEYLEEVRQDFAFAMRQMGRARGFTATAAATLALGIGATVAVFSALYAVAIRPMPFADAERVVQLVATRRGETEDIFSSGEFAAIREQRSAFAYVAAVSGGGLTLTGMGVPEMLQGAQVTADYFRVLGVAPALGRGFLASDDVEGAPSVALLSHRLWTTRFAADTTLVGRTIRLDDEPVTVVGVMPAAFDAAGTENDLWTPQRLTATQLTTNSGRWLAVVARLTPNVTLAQAGDAAGSAVKAVAARTPGASQNVTASVRRYLDGVAGAPRERLLILFGAVVLVLLISCVNVANLLLARGSIRAREMAIRAALGAGRSRLIRQLLVETLVLSLAAAGIGIIIAFGLVKGLVMLGPEDTPRLDQASVNAVVLAFTLGIAVVSSVLVGLVPAIRSARPALQSTLREGGRGSAGAPRDRLRATLVAAEVALAMTLLIGAGLLIRTAWHLQRVDPGFRPTNVLTARLLPPRARYSDAALTTRTYSRIREAASAVPGVERVGLVSVVPLAGGHLGTRIAAEGKSFSTDDRLAVDIRYTSPEYFSAMGMPLREGRDFAREDVVEAPAVAVISASLAAKLWPGEPPLGKRIDAMGTQSKPNWLTIVGVVADVHNDGLNAPVTPTVYMPFTQTPAAMWNVTARSLVLVVRTARTPEAIVRPLQEAVMTIDPLLPLVDVNTMQGLLSESLAASRFNTLLLATLGALALVLASIGVYGVVAYYVSQRTREIGVHMALGAAPADIWRLVLSRGMRPIVWGAIAGVGLSLATVRVLRGQLYGVSAQDPATVIAVVGTLFAVALIATCIPAMRAIRVSPARALTAD